MAQLTVIDLFCGIGGFSIGFERAGFEVLAGVERVDQLRSDFARAHPNAVTAHSDVVSLRGRNLLRRLGLRVGELDVLVGGPPCQAFSTAGKRMGTDDERGLLIGEFVRLVGEIRPKAFIIENVVGLLSIHNGTLLEAVTKDLRGWGYTVVDPTILNAAEFGVPQVRRRVFIAGLRGKRAFEFPKPTHWRPEVAEASRRKRFVTVSEAIGDLPTRPDIDADAFSDADEIPYACSADNDYQSLMRGRRRKVDGNGVSIHQPHIAEAIATLAPGAIEPKTRYRRLYSDRPSFTLRAGSGTFTALRPIHPHLPRVITVREAARLQSFPDTVRFSPVKRSAYQEIGNAVPPLLAQAVARRLADFLT